MRGLKIPAIIALIVVAGVAGYLLGHSGLTPLQRENQKLARLNQTLAHQEVALFFIHSTPQRYYLQPVLTKLPRTGGEIHHQALEALFAGPPVDSGLDEVFPKDAKVLSLKIKDGLAVVNLNQAATRINVGAPGEALAIAALVNTLTKFPDVYRVQILIEGELAESLAGHVDLTQTFEYNNRDVVVE